MNDIFVSYSHKDKIKVDRIVNELKSKGFSISYDEDFSAGQDWTRKAKEYIVSTKSAIFFMSENSITSEPVLIELKAAFNENKKCDYYFFAVLLDNITIADLYKSIRKSEDFDSSEKLIASEICDIFPDEKLYLNNDDYVIDRIIDSLKKNDIYPSVVNAEEKKVIDGKRVDSYVTSQYALFNIEKEISIFPIYNEEREKALNKKQYIDDNGSILYRLVFLPSDYINNPINSVHLMNLKFQDAVGNDFIKFNIDKPLDCDYSTNVLQRCYNCICVDVLTDKDISYLFEKVKTVVMDLDIRSIFNVSMIVRYYIEIHHKKNNENNMDKNDIPELETFTIHHTKYQILDRLIKED